MALQPITPIVPARAREESAPPGGMPSLAEMQMHRLRFKSLAADPALCLDVRQAAGWALTLADAAIAQQRLLAELEWQIAQIWGPDDPAGTRSGQAGD